MNLTKAERETIARFSEDPEEPLSFETFNKKHALRLIKAGATVRATATRGNSTYWTLSCPREWFKWPRPKSSRRILDQKSKDAIVARFAKARKKAALKK